MQPQGAIHQVVGQFAHQALGVDEQFDAHQLVGGGVIGVSTAWYLRQQGLSVLVLEKGRVAGERRVRAARIAGIGEIPALVCSLAESESMRVALLEKLPLPRHKPCGGGMPVPVRQELLDGAVSELPLR
mgnify:CR=1 FL=1